MLIPYIGGEIPKSKANKAVKEKAAGLGTTSKEAVDNAKKIEKSTQETAKAENKIAEATKVVKVDSVEVAKNKQDEAKATKQVADNKEKEANASNKVVEAKKKEIEVVQNVKDNTTEIVQDKKDEQVVATQVAKVEEKKADTISDIANTQKEIVVITEKANEVNQEELQAMKDELNAKEKLGAEQKAQLATTRLEIKEAEKKEKSISKSIEQENKMIGKMQEKIALAKDAEDFISRVLFKVTLLGATYLAILAALPIIFTWAFGLPASVSVGGTSIMIVVGVAIETAKQIKQESESQEYHGFL